MPTETDIYSIELIDKHHSLRYIHVVTRNVVGILNRISSLMRRKRYNMEEVSVSFDSHNKAHILVAVDGRLIDVVQLIHLLQKLHDVYDAYDVTEERDKMYNAFYVLGDSTDEFNGFPIPAVRVIRYDGNYKGIFMVQLQETPTMIKYLAKNGYDYEHRLLSLV